MGGDLTPGRQCIDALLNVLQRNGVGPLLPLCGIVACAVVELLNLADSCGKPEFLCQGLEAEAVEFRGWGKVESQIHGVRVAHVTGFSTRTISLQLNTQLSPVIPWTIQAAGVKVEKHGRVFGGFRWSGRNDYACGLYRQVLRSGGQRDRPVIQYSCRFLEISLDRL